jgi:hypothetical protein
MFNNVFKDQAYRAVLLMKMKFYQGELEGRYLHSPLLIEHADQKLKEYKIDLVNSVKRYFNHTSDYVEGRIVRKIKTPFNSYQEYQLPSLEINDLYIEKLSRKVLLKNHQNRVEKLRVDVRSLIQSGSIIEKPKLRDLQVGDHRLNGIRNSAICSGAVLKYVSETGDVSDFVISDMFNEIRKIDSYQYASNRFTSVNMARFTVIDSNPPTSQDLRTIDRGTFECNLYHPNIEGHMADDYQLSLTGFKIPKAIQTAKMTAIRDNLEEIDNLLGIHL